MITDAMTTERLPHLATPLTARSSMRASKTSVGLCAFALALTLLFAGGIGPGSIQMLQFVVSSMLLLLILSLVILVSKGGRLSQHMGYLMMLFGAVYWFVAPSLMISLQSDYSITSRYGMMVHPKSISTACAYMTLFVTSSVWVYWLCLPRAVACGLRTEGDRDANRIHLLILALFLAGFIPYILFGGEIEYVIKSILAGRTTRPPWKAGALGDERSAVYYLSRSGMVAAASFAGSWAFLSTKSRLRLPLLGIFFVTCVLVYFDGGTRSWLALTAVPVLLTWATRTLKNRITLSHLCIFFVAVLALQLTFEFARVSRNRGWHLSNIQYIDPWQREFDNDFVSELAVAIELVPRRHDYFMLGDFWAFISHPVPRFLWREKPTSPILVYYNDAVFFGLFAGRGNKLPSHLGQFHMSFGWAGIVLLGSIAGVVGAYATGLMRSGFVPFVHLGAALATWWFIMGRGVYPGWTYVLLFTWILAVFGFRRKHQVRPA